MILKGTNRADLELLISRLCAVPISAREFDADDTKLKDYGIDHELSRSLITLGMPSRLIRGKVYFDETDLANVALQLQLASQQMNAMPRWANSILRACDLVDRGGYRVSVVITGSPSGDPNQAVEISYKAGVDKTTSIMARSGDQIARFDHRIRQATVRLDHRVASVIESLVAKMTFWNLPPLVTGDTKFCRETGVVDCTSGAMWIAEELKKCGTVVRVVVGLFLSSPFSFEHTWLDVYQDSQWVSISPVIVKLLTRGGHLDKCRWLPSASLSGVLLPLSYGPDPLISCNGARCRVGYFTELIEQFP